MPPAPTLSRPPTPQARRLAPWPFVVVVLAAALAAGVLSTLATLLDEPARVDVVVENPTPYPLDVVVSRPDGSSSTRLGTVSPERVRTFPSVPDQGDEWVFRFGYGGVDGGTVTVPAVDLGEALVVPDEVAETLAAEGAEAPPR